MFGNNSGIELSLQENEKSDITVKVSADRDGYILLFMGIAILLTTNLFDPAKEFTFKEFIAKKAIILAIGISVIIYSLAAGFRKFKFVFDAEKQQCEVTETHLFWNKKSYSNVVNIRCLINIADSEGPSPSRYIASFIIDGRSYLLGESSDRDYFFRTFKNLKKFNIKCETS